MTDQPLTDPGPIENTDEEIDYSIPRSAPNESGSDVDFRVESDGIPMKQVYKFFQIAILNEREELQFNKDFEGWAVAGMATHGARVVILGTKFVSWVEEDVKEALVEVEKTPPGALGDEVDEKDASKSPVRKTKVVDPFRK